jgi:hypothetical protein
MDMDLASSDFMARSVSENNPIFVNNRSSLRIFDKIEEEDESVEHVPHVVGQSKLLN